MKRNVLIAFIVCHLGFIFVANVCLLCGSYNEFKGRAGVNGIVGFLGKMSNSQAGRVYGDYTGAGAGYGFFGVNVRSAGVLVAQCGVKSIVPHFRSYETALRFSSMLDAITNVMLTPPGTAMQDSYTSRFSDLAIKGIAARLLRGNCGPDSSITVRYCLAACPSLAEYRAGSRAGQDLTTIKSITYQIR